MASPRIYQVANLQTELTTTADSANNRVLRAGDTMTGELNVANNLVVTGNVGIGTSVPGAKLSVDGSVIFNDSGADVDFRIEGDTDANLFFVDASTDRIGIGTNTPNSKLHVSLANTQRVHFGSQLSQNDEVILGLGYTEGASYNKISIIANRVYDNGGGDLFFALNSTAGGSNATTADARLTIKGDTGNVGIGTSSPAHVLVAKGTNPIAAERATDTDRLLLNWDGITSYANSVSAYNNFIFTSSNNSGSVERARITGGGDLLVGTTSFTNAANKGLAVRFSSATNSGGEGGVEIRNTSSSVNSDPNPPLIIYKGSTTTSSDQRFIQFYANDTGQPMGGIVGNGATNVQFVSLSDVREKKNIKPISGSLEKVTALNPVSFEWIKSGEVVGAGFVAQDVEQVFPEFVVENFSNNDEEPRKGLTGGMTGGIIPHLVKAIQELSAKNDALEARLAQLESN